MKFIIGEKPHLTFQQRSSCFTFPPFFKAGNQSILREPSTAGTRVHDFIKFATASFETVSHDLIIHSTTSLLGTGLMFSAAVYSCFPFVNQSSYNSRTLPLKGLFQASSTCTHLVQPPGTKTVSILELVSVFLILAVKWASKESHANNRL